MKNLFKKIGQIPLAYYGLGMILGNVVAASVNNIPAIIWFNVFGLIIGLIGITYRPRD